LVGRSWRMDETYIKIKGQWHYLCRALDKCGQTIDVLLTQTIRRHGVFEKITIDGGEAKAAASRSYNAEHRTAMIIRQVKYLNNS
jgi:putative transposase